MKTPLALLALACMVGCTPPPFTPKNSCDAAPFGRLYTEENRDCACLARNSAHALEALEAAGEVPKGVDWSGVDVWIMSTNDTLPEKIAGDDETLGLYQTGPDSIIENRKGAEMGHELIHRYRLHTLGVDEKQEAQHVGWSRATYHAAYEGWQFAIDNPCD